LVLVRRRARQSDARAVELSEGRGIRATFFVNGHCFGQGVYQSGQCQQDASASPFDILGRLVADGHLVANHTQDHFDLTSLDDNSIVRQLADTDA
jgi:peptidoglycan/xylan/chitin deacetylase (PgdA/CDA1 family)